MARRYQKGKLSLEGKNKDVWYGRWRQDEKRPDGTYHRAYRNQRLGTKEEFPTRRLAQRALDKFLAEVNDLDYQPETTITFGVFAQTWLDEVLAMKEKKTTRTSMGGWTRHHIIPYFEHQRLADITPLRIQEFVNHLRKLGLMPRSVKAIYMTMRSIWRTALLWGKVKHDPFPRKGIELPKVRKTERQPFTEEETRQIIEAAQEPDKTLYWLLAETGLRAGEALALQVKDVDFGHGVVVVEKNWVAGEMGAPKSESGYRNPALSPELLAHLHQRYQTASATDYLVPGAKPGRPLTYAAFLDRLHKLERELGIVRRGFHGFRYTNGTVSVAEGVDVKVLQQRLGHSSPVLTLALYARAVSAGERTLAAKLGAKFAPKLHRSA